MRRKLRKKKQCFTQKPFQQISYDRIMSMRLIESTGKIRLLHDSLHGKGFDPSNMYIILDGRTNQTYQTPELATAQWFYNSHVRSTRKTKLIADTDKNRQKTFIIY